MSITSKFFVLGILLVGLLLVPAFAEQTADGIIVGDDNTQIIENKETTFIKHQDVKVDEQVDAHSTTYVTYEAPVDNSPHINYLGIGDASETRLMFPDEALVFAVSTDQSYDIRSANPVAVYLIRRYSNDFLLVDSTESKMTYNPVYHKFEHGIVAPSWIFPQFTTKCHVEVGADEYLVIDNRYFPDYSLIEIQPATVKNEAPV